MRPVQLLIGLCAVISPLAVQAQVDAGTLLNQQQRQQQRLPERLPDAQRPAQQPALTAPAGQKITLKAVRFTGAVQLTSEAELQAVVAPSIGKELDFAGLEQLAARVTDLLKAKGWFLARAYLPRQDITGGQIEIAILAGRLDGSTNQTESYRLVANDKSPLRIDPSRLTAIAARQLPPGATVRMDQLERAMLLMNDLPGITARAHLEPGTEADSTRVVLNALEGPLFAANAWVDNYGSADTGVNQLNLAAQLNDPTHRGDQASLSLTHTEGLDLARLGYVLPLGADGLKLSGNLSSMSYEVIRGTGLIAGLKGNSTTSGLNLTYPYLRSRAANLNTSLGYTHKALKDESAAGTLRDKRLDNWSLGLSADSVDRLGGGGYNAAGLTWTQGQVDLSRNAGDASADAASYATQGSFNKWGYNLTRLQKLPGAITLFATLSGQATDKNLDSSEQFILGGPNGVRAYPGSEAMGDAGWLANLELRYDLPGATPLGQLQLTGFYDSGHITLHHDAKGVTIPTATGDNSYGLAGWGLAVNLTKPGRYSVRAGWARKIGDNPGRSLTGLDADSSADTSRLWLQATFSF
jgi:hemolysin activation/secretion protein